MLDTGAPISITPYKSDFVRPLEPSRIKSINELNSSEKVEGRGTVRWVVKDVNGVPFAIETFALYLPVGLFSSNLS